MRQLSAAGRCTSGYYPSSAIHSCSSVKNALSSSGSSIFTCNSAGAASCCSTSRCISDARSPCLPSTSGPSVEPGWGHSKPGTWYGFHSTQQPRHIRTSASASGPGPSEALPASTSTQTKATRYSPLHYNVEEFAARIVPTEEERKIKSQIVEIIRTTTKKVFADIKRVDVEIFGSFANGLSTWSSDVDLVVTGIMEPDRSTGVYSMSDRGRVTARLRKIGEALRHNKKLDNPRITIIPRARIPIIKLKVKSVAVDISLGDGMGPHAARYLAQQSRAYPPMRPLVLVLKAYLKSQGLNDVSVGGLSSYSLCNMVIAHLQEELKAGRDIYDLGEALYAFLLRYGEEFDYERDAVSVACGGIVPKQALGICMEGARQAVSASYYDDTVPWYQRLVVDCPLSSRDVSCGTYRIDAVRASFQRASRRLEALARGRKISDNSLNYLQALFDVSRVTKRSASGTFAEYNDDFISVLGPGTGHAMQRGEGGVDGEEEELLDEAGSEDDGVVMFDDSGDSSTDTDRDVRRAVAQDSDGEDVSPGKGRGGARSKRRR